MPGGSFKCCSGLSMLQSLLHCRATGPCTLLSSRAKQSSFSSCKSQSEIYNLISPNSPRKGAVSQERKAPGTALISVQEKEEVKVKSLLSCRNIPVTGSAVRDISTPLGTAPQLCSKINWAMQGAPWCCYWARGQFLLPKWSCRKHYSIKQKQELTESTYHYKAIVPVAIICLNISVIWSVYRILVYVTKWR